MATPDDAVNLAFKVAGQVLDVPVSQGAGVKKGELLAELDPRDIELQVAATRSAFEETRSQHAAHAAAAGARGGVAAGGRKRPQTRYAQATLDLREHPRPAEGHHALKAPFAGVVERKYVDNFERVQAGQSDSSGVVNPGHLDQGPVHACPKTALPLLSWTAPTRFTVAFDNYRGVRPFRPALKEYVETSSDASGFPVSLTPRQTPIPARYPHLARHVVHDHHVERRSRSRCRVAARFGRLRPGRGRHLRLDRRRAATASMRREVTLGRAVRPRPGGRRQRRCARRTGRHGGRLPAARGRTGPHLKLTPP